MYSKHLLTRTGSGDTENSQFYSLGAVLEGTLEEPHITHQGRNGHIVELSCPFPGFGLVALAECQ